MRSQFFVVACLLGSVLAGCSQGDGQNRFRVSGEVKYGGKPVPYGEVLFTPDGSKKNSGAQGITTIKDGRYDTRGSRAPGTAGGPIVVRVTALSDPNGKLLVEYEFSIDLPKSDSVHNIEIPAKSDAAAPKTKPALPEI